MVVYDDIGPERIFEVYNPKTGLHGFLVIDNTARGVGKGGLRMTPTVSVDEVARLARAMTLKCALAELPFGGAKSGIVYKPGQDKAKLVAEFAKALKPVCPSIYVAGPDISTTENEMAVFAKANGDMKSATGKPAALGGIPHELGSTGFGVAHAAAVAAKFLGWDLSKKTFAVEGFGNVGTFVSKFLIERGAKLVAVSDSKGVAYLKSGFDYDKLSEIKRTKGSVTAYPRAKVTAPPSIISVKADMLVTAAVPDLITTKNYSKIKAKLIVEGSNIPATPEVEERLHKKKITVVPDFVANAGGVISSYVEYKGGTPQEMFKLVEEKIVKNTRLVLERSKKDGIKPRDAAVSIAKERVLG